MRRGRREQEHRTRPEARIPPLPRLTTFSPSPCGFTAYSLPPARTAPPTAPLCHCVAHIGEIPGRGGWVWVSRTRASAPPPPITVLPLLLPLFFACGSSH